MHDEPGIGAAAFFIKGGDEIALVYRLDAAVAPSKQPTFVRVFDSETFDLVDSNSLPAYGIPHDASPKLIASAGSTKLVVSNPLPAYGILQNSSHELIASAGRNNPETILYDLRSGEERYRFPGIRLPRVITHAPDGKRIAFATTMEKEVSLWSLESNQRLLSLPAPTTIFHMAFTSDGNRILVAHLTARKELAITTWDATPLTE